MTIQKNTLGGKNLKLNKKPIYFYAARTPGSILSKYLISLGNDTEFPDESCESVLVNGISVLLAILETRKAVNNSYNTNDYLDTCSTGT